MKAITKDQIEKQKVSDRKKRDRALLTCGRMFGGFNLGVSKIKIHEDYRTEGKNTQSKNYMRCEGVLKNGVKVHAEVTY